MNEESSLQSILPFNHLDSIYFNIALYEVSHGTLNYNSNCIESLLYNPIDQPGLFDPLSNNLYPDSNFPTRLPTSRYMVEEDINDQVSSFNEESTFLILHLNARSLLKNLDQLNFILKSLKRAFSVVSVSETWLTDSTSELVNITGYNFVSNHRKSHLFTKRY